MRSSWEVKYALWLDRNKYTWLYEPRPFTVKNGRKYYPDFYVKELDEWHEVKGIFTDVSKQKVAEFRELYPKLILKMLFKDDLKALGVL
jgi:Uma2 family endonuclease